VLGPLVTDAALLTLAKLAGLTTGDAGGEEPGEPDSDFYDDVIASLAEAKASRSLADEDEGDVEADDDAESDVGDDRDGFDRPDGRGTGSNGMQGGSRHHEALERGRRDRRKSKMEGEEEEQGEEEEGGEEAQRREALKVLCNVVYNSTWAQERFSELRWVSHTHTHTHTHTQRYETQPHTPAAAE